MEGAVKHLIPGIDADCGGACACATCQVYVAPGWEEKLPPKSDMEETMLDFAPDVQAQQPAVLPAADECGAGRHCAQSAQEPALALFVTARFRRAIHTVGGLWMARTGRAMTLRL